MPPTWDRPRRTSNIAPLLFDIKARIALLLLNTPGFGRRMSGMKHTVPILAILALTLLPVPARAADCYADYKAKQEQPLRLHYGVMQVATCSAGQAAPEVAARLQTAGWTLLNVISVFGPEGLDKRKADAGPYFLRF